MNANERVKIVLHDHLEWLKSGKASGYPVKRHRLDLIGINASEIEVSTLARANFSKANLDSVNLAGANLDSAKFFWAYLSNARFCKANLPCANLSYANMSWSNFSKVSFFHANLNNATLLGTNLRHADFDGADVRGADLTNADLTGARLDGANLCGTTGVVYIGNFDTRYDTRVLVGWVKMRQATRELWFNSGFNSASMKDTVSRWNNCSDQKRRGRYIEAIDFMAKMMGFRWQDKEIA